MKARAELGTNSTSNRKCKPIAPQCIGLKWSLTHVAAEAETQPTTQLRANAIMTTKMERENLKALMAYPFSRDSLCRFGRPFPARSQAPELGNKGNNHNPTRERGNQSLTDVSGYHKSYNDFRSFAQNVVRLGNDVTTRTRNERAAVSCSYFRARRHLLRVHSTTPTMIKATSQPIAAAVLPAIA